MSAYHFQCAICLESMGDTNDTFKLPCSHAFCFVCLWQWTKIRKTCPVCRANVSGYDHAEIELICIKEKCVAITKIPMSLDAKASRLLNVLAGQGADQL